MKSFEKTLKSVICIAIAVVVSLTMLGDTAFAADAKDDITPLSKAAILYEETSDTVIYEKNKDMP